MNSVAFIDLEASGLGPKTWPIEVGWCFLDTPPEAYLIRPDKDWPRDAWDENAQSLHGVGLSELEKTGLDPSEICERLNASLANARVYSDAPDWDGFWLHRLFDAGSMRQEFELSDFNELFDGMARAEVLALSERAAATAPHRHRARDDVLHMNAVYNLARKA